MKKRFISAFLALAMLFSMFPTTFANQTIDADGKLSGDDIISSLDIVINNGKLETFKFKVGSEHDNAGTQVYAAIASNYNNTGADTNDIIDTLTDDDIGVDYIKNGSEDAFSSPFYQWAIPSATAGDEIVLNTENVNSHNYDWSDGSTGYGSAYATGYGSVYVDGEVYIRVIILINATGKPNNDYSTNGFVADIGPLDSTRSLKYPASGGGTSKTKLSSVDVSLAKPTYNGTPAATASSGTTGATTGAVSWDGTPSTFAMATDYTAEFDITAGSDYEFDTTSSFDVNLKDSSLPSGYTPTVDITSNNGSKAHVKITYPAITVKSVTFAPNNSSKPVASGATDTLPTGDIKAFVTYNNESAPATFPYASFPSWITLTNSGNTLSGTTVSNITNGSTIGAKVDKSVTSTGADLTGTLYTYSVADTPITTATVNFAFPVIGANISNVASTTDTSYTITDNEVVWTTDGSNATGVFEYGKAYTAGVALTATAGNSLSNSTNITFADTGSSSTVTATHTDGTDPEYTFSAQPNPTLTLNTTSEFDYYNSGNDVAFTIAQTNNIITNVTGVSVNSTALNAGEYSVSGTTLTLTAAGLNRVAGTSLTSTATSWPVNVTFAGNGTASSSFNAVDTTPYITITNPSNSTISSNPNVTVGSKQALTKGTTYTLTVTEPAHTTGVAWDVKNGATAIGAVGSSRNTYTFTPSGSENITATATVTVDSGHTLTINKTGNGTVTVTNGSGPVSEISTGSGTYTVYSDENYTVTATADSKNKVTAVTGETINGVQKTVTHAVNAPSADTTVNVTFEAMTAPTVDNNTTLTFRKDDNTTSITYTYTLGDYTDVSVSGGGGSLDKANKTYTISNANLKALTDGINSITFTFTSANGNETVTRNIDVKPARTIKNVKLPSATFKHGDTFNLTGFEFTITDGGTDITYKYGDTSWNSIPSDVYIKLGSGSALTPTAFANAYVGKTTRHDTKVSADVHNGEQITVSAGSATASSAALSIAKKDIVLDASTTDTNGFNKTYDGTATVTASPINWALASGNSWVSGDTINPADITITGKYQKSGAFGTDDANAENLKSIKFTAAATAGTDAANNYNITVNNRSGEISAKSLTITSVPNIPSAPSGVAQSDTVTETITNTNLDASTPLASADSTGITIKYTYTYDASTSTSVNISEITSQNTNYTITPTSLNNQTGSRNARTVKTITVAPTTTTYNYSDTLSAVTITVEYNDSYGNSVYNNIADAVAAGVSVYWGTDTSAAATDGQTLNVSAHSKNLTAAFGGKTGSAAITVKPLPVIVTVNGTMTKEYDGDTTYDATDNAGGSITYSAAIDTSMTGYKASYGTQFTNDSVTATGATVAFNSKDVPTANAAVVSNGTISDTSGNYKVTSTANNVTSASITAKTVNVTAITNVPEINQGEATLSGTGATATNKSGATMTGVVGTETVQITYNWAYSQSTNAVDPDNTVAISGVALDTVANNDANKNYTLGTSPSTGTGAVKARTVSDITVTDLSDKEYTYGEQLALSGLQVQISYNTGAETYVWKSEASGVTTWTKQVSGESDVDVTNVPFTLTWNTNGGTPTNNFDVTVAYNNDKIKATSTVDPSKSNTNNGITVNPIKVKTIAITGLDKTKVYDGTATLTSPGFTYALTDSTILPADASTLAVAPTTVEYSSADVHTSQDLKISGWGLTNSVNGNYELDSTSNLVITGTPKGTITQRPITLNSIEYVPAVDQYSAATATDGTAESNATGTNTKANIAASTGGDDGLVSGQNVTVSFNYQYDDTSTAGTNNIAVTVNGTPTISNANYDLQLAAGFAAKGTVNSVAASAIAVQAQPAQFTSGAEYGDKLNYSGLIIKVDYGTPVSKTKYFKYTGTDWKECADDGTNETALSGTLPFAVTITDSKTQGSDLLTVGTVTVTATLSGDNTKTAVATLNVGKRKVNVTPSGTATKMYDGNDSYTGTGITYTVDYVSAPAATITKPTVQSATVTFDEKTVAATQVTVTNPVLSDPTNFTVNSIANSGVVTGATITKRPIKLTAITNIPEVNQFATANISGTNQSATNPTDAVFATSEDTVGGTTTYPIVSGDTVTVKYDYAYTDTATVSPTDNVDLSNVALDTAEPNPNYELKDATNGKATKAPIVRTVDTVTVTKPTQLQNAATYKDELNLSGMTVTVNYTSGNPDVYTATQSAGTVTWTKDSVTVAPPFTYQWTNTSKGANIAANEVLTVPAHNGNTITVSLTDGNGKTGVSAPVTVEPKKITAITATLTSGEIAKEYDSKTELEAADKALIKYTFTGLDSGDTVTLTTTPSYQSKDVGDAIDIEFTTPSISGNDNYALADNVEVTDSLTGKITQKAVTITGVNVPITYKQENPTANEEISVSDAALASDTVADKTVTATGFIDNEGQALKFNYTIVYQQSDLSTAGSKTVTIKDGAGTVSGTGSGNYSYTWPTGLTGNVLDDQFTDVTITQPTKMTGYTHGDVFDPSGMSVTIKTSSNSTGTTHTVISNGAGGYKWDTALPTGASVTVGTVSLTSDADLNRNAHYTNMNGKAITITAGDKNASTTDTVVVVQKQLSATASVTGTLEKAYNANTDLPTGTTIGYTIGTGEVQSFGGVADTVSVTATAAYENKDVNATVGDNYKKLIKITGIGLTGADAGNYIKPATIGDLEGKITPFALEVTKINDTIPDAYWNNQKEDTVTTSNYTTAQTAPDTGLEITYKYTYDDTSRVGTVTNGVTISNVDLSPANTNYTVTYTGGKMDGKVVTQGIASLSITQQPTTNYKYGETLDLSNLEVTVTYSDGGGSDYVRYGDDDWNTLGLKIDDASLKHGDALKTTDAGSKIKVTTSDGSKYAETNELTVEQRTLYITATPASTVTKTYDGTTAVNQTVTLAIGGEGPYDGTYYDGLLGTDTYTLSNATPLYTYEDKNVGTGKALTMGEAVTLVGTNAGEYAITFQSLTGDITAKDVTLTPVIADIPVNKFATTDTTITETGIGIGDKLTQNGIVSSEVNNFTFNYTVTVSTTQLGTIDTYTITPTATSESGTGKDNYNFTWNDATVNVVPNAMTGIAVKTDPTDLANSKVYGDGIALDGMVVTATYADASTHNFTYNTTAGSEWANEGFTVAIEDGGDLTKLVTGNSGKHIVVSKTGLTNANTNGTLTVNKKPLTLTATATKENLTREYNSLTSADETKITLGTDTSTPLVTGDTIDYGTYTADYYKNDSKDKNAENNKIVKVSTITPTIENSSNVDVTDQYDITQPSALTGEIKAKSIKVTGIGVPNILTGASELTKNVTTSYTNGAIYTGDDVTVPITAKYPDSLQDGANRRTQKTVTFAIGTITGADKDNYSFSLDPATGTGWVVDNLINKITVTPPSDTEYEHGDSLNLAGMVIAVEYQNNVDNNTYTYVSGDNWTDKSGTTVTTSSLPVSFVLVKDSAETPVTSATKQLRHDDNGESKLVVKGDDITNEDNGGSTINITVGKKEITEIAPGYAPPTTAKPEKQYDGTTKVPDNSFVYYSDDILPADKSVVQPLLGATAEYSNKNASYEADGTTLKDIDINFTNPTLGTNDNYTLANNATIDTSGNLKGTISKAPLTITITSVPPITVGQNPGVTLTKDTNYTQTGEVTVNGVKETVDVAVKGTYTDNNTPANGTAAVTYTTDPTTLTNYNISLLGTDTKGTVNNKPVTGIAVTAPTKPTYEHGDNLALKGMTITVSYGTQENPDDKVYTYVENVGWTLSSDPTTAVTPADITINWTDTKTANNNDKLRLDDTDKGYTDGTDGAKTATITVKATVPNTVGGTTYESGDTTITVTPKQLTLTVEGAVSKKYDGNNNLLATDVLTFTLNGVQSKDGTTDAVSVDETATRANITYNGTGTGKKNVNSTSVTGVAVPKLEIGTIVLTGNNTSYYKVPVVATDATNTVTNNTTGEIEKRPIKVVAITKSMDAAIGTSNGTLKGIGSDSYTLSSDTGLYQLVNGEDVKIDVPYTYGDTSIEGDTTVTFDNANAKVSDTTPTLDNSQASNYDVSFTIDNGTAHISNGTVTGVALSGQFQTAGYVHGDPFSLDNMEITITYNNDSTKTDKYVYAGSGKWTLIRNGGTPETTPVSLPSEITLKLGSTPINTNPASDNDKTIVKYGNDTNKLVATYSKDTTTVNSDQSAEYEVDQKEITINITPPSTPPLIEQEYSGKNNKSLNDENLAKLSISKPTNFAVDGDTVSIKDGTLKAEFASGSVARDGSNAVIAQAITIPSGVFELDGADKGNYILNVVCTATGTITPKAAIITANTSNVPPILEGADAAGRVVTITDYLIDGFVEGDTPTITWKGTYNTSDPNASEIKVDTTTTRTLDADTQNNYDVTWLPDSMDGTVTEKVVTNVEVIAQPKFSTTSPKHGDKVGDDGLVGLEYKVTYNNGDVTKHKVGEDGNWITTDGYTAPEDGTTFKWNDTTEDVSKDSVIRKDKANTVTIAVGGKNGKTATVTAAARPVTVKAVGTYTKPYDGNNKVTLNETTPEITYVIDGLAAGDDITVTATPEFADENVAKFGDAYVKAINFKDVTVNGDDDVLANYEFTMTDGAVKVDTTELNSSITPKTMNITAITVPGKTKGAAAAVNVTGSKNFTTTDIVEKDKNTVTIKYEGAYSSTSVAGTSIPVSITDGTLAIDGDAKAMLNYTPVLAGEATGSITGGGGGGGGGGSISNSLAVKYKNEDGTAGDDAVKIEATTETKPVDLIGVFKTKPSNTAITWSSDNEKVATVDENGTVTFVGVGKATITAKAKANAQLKDTVEIVVAEPTPTPTPTPTPQPEKDPSLITKTMLNPYIVGYENNVFGPELPISREEVTAIFARLIANNIYMDKDYDTRFPDVQDGWSKNYIGYLEGFKIVNGYEDGLFRPKNYITRAEMAVMMAKAEGYDISGYMSADEVDFPDVDEGYSTWAVKAIKVLTDAGVMQGYTDGTFRPNRPITRAETVATVNRVLADMEVKSIEVLPSDVTDAHWAYNDIVFAMNHRILKDAAADPQKFVWSEEFDENMVVEKEVVENSDKTAEDENSSAQSDAISEENPEPTATPEVKTTN